MTPVANNVSAHVQKNVNSMTPIQEPPSFNDGILWNDTGFGSTPVVAVVTAPAHAATFSVDNNGTLRYKGTTNYVGSDSFTYKVSGDNGSTWSNVATVNIAVEGGTWSHPVAQVFLDR